MAQLFKKACEISTFMGYRTIFVFKRKKVDIVFKHFDFDPDLLFSFHAKGGSHARIQKVLSEGLHV